MRSRPCLTHALSQGSCRAAATPCFVYFSITGIQLNPSPSSSSPPAPGIAVPWLFSKRVRVWKARPFIETAYKERDVCACCLSLKTFAQVMAIQCAIRSSARNTSVWIDTVICVSILHLHVTGRLVSIHVDCERIGVYSYTFLIPVLI